MRRRIHCHFPCAGRDLDAGTFTIRQTLLSECPSRDGTWGIAANVMCIGRAGFSFAKGPADPKRR
jgi:hypothetical protein